MYNCITMIMYIYIYYIYTCNDNIITNPIIQFPSAILSLFGAFPIIMGIPKTCFRKIRWSLPTVELLCKNLCPANKKMAMVGLG